MNEDKLAEVRARLDAQQDAQDSDETDQKAVDLMALADARDEHGGPSAVQAASIPYVAGLPTMAIVRRPTKIEFKRFTDTVSKKDASGPEYMAAAQALAAVCLVYPPKDVYAKMCEAVPGLPVPLGIAATKLATGKEKEDRKF